MSTPEQPPEKVSDRLHPVVQLAAAGLLIWFVVAAWLLFGGAGYVNLALVMISVLVFMALAIPWVLWRAGVAGRRRNAELGDDDETPSETLATWLQGRFATWTDAERPSTGRCRDPVTARGGRIRPHGPRHRVPTDPCRRRLKEVACPKE
jgi:hypothetical protein